ncbi:MAG: DHA2 family efflux MFS transporter permease subunit [Anaerolineales bacterium]|nr:MAG: DHA2 family efflux MFS transporter permease subunit [Anaerolineales bacterium]
MQQPVDYSRKWHVMAAVVMGVFLSTIDGSIVNVALPTLVRGFQTEFAVVQWVVLAYLLTVTTLMLSVGRLGDMIGKKPVYATGFIIFTVGSVLCGLAPTIYWLIGLRVLQAIGASMMMALGTAIVTEAFPPSERGTALGIIGSMVSVGIVAGPVLGGILISSLSWHWIFFVNLPIGVIGSLMVSRFVPDLKPAGVQRFDFPGAATLFASLMALLQALTLGQRVGFTQTSVLLLFATWLFFLAIFLAVELKSNQPMIDLSLFQNRLFSINLVTGFITFIAVAGTIILMPFYLENVLGYDPRSVGFLLAVVPVAMGITAPIAGSLSDRLGTRPITVIGLVVLLVGYYFVSTLSTQTDALGYVVRFLPIGVGMGIFQSPNNSAIMGTAPRTRLGVASGLLSITRTLGQTTGVATLGALWASRVAYRLGDTSQQGTIVAPAATQVAGLQDTFVAVVILIGLALALGIWGLAQEWWGRGVPKLAVESPERQ